MRGRQCGNQRGQPWRAGNLAHLAALHVAPCGVWSGAYSHPAGAETPRLGVSTTFFAERAGCRHRPRRTAPTMPLLAPIWVKLSFRSRGCRCGISAYRLCRRVRVPCVVTWRGLSMLSTRSRPQRTRSDARMSSILRRSRRRSGAASAMRGSADSWESWSPFAPPQAPRCRRAVRWLLGPRRSLSA